MSPEGSVVYDMVNGLFNWASKSLSGGSGIQTLAHDKTLYISWGRVFSHAGYKLVPSYERGIREEWEPCARLAGNELVSTLTKKSASA